MTKDEILTAVKMMCKALDKCAETAHDEVFSDYVTDFHMFLACTIEDTDDFTDAQHYLDEKDHQRFFVLIMYTFLYTSCETFSHALHIDGKQENELTASGRFIADLCNEYEERLINHLNI